MKPLLLVPLFCLLGTSLQQENNTKPAPLDPNIVISSVQVSTSPLFVTKKKAIAGSNNSSKDEAIETARPTRALEGQFHSPSADFQSFLGPQQYIPHLPVLTHDQSEIGQTPYKTDYFYAGLLPLAPTTRPVCQLAPAPCDPNARYRTYDGSCNNLQNPTWGMTGSLFARLVPPKYADGISIPFEEGLPLARVLSSTLFPDVNLVDPIWTLIAMQWSQVITHDMSMAAGSRQHKPKPIECCASDGHDLARNWAEKNGCFPIRIPADDPFYAQHNQRCMDFMRSSNDIATGCNNYGPANQMTAVTSYLDLSLVYGSNAETARSLREFRDGRLISQTRDNRMWLPESNNRSADCENVDANEPCYRSGDVRVNQNPAQALVQTLLLREHNRLAAALQYLNPTWDDETLFQEARRIAVAEFQHISYYEWLPILLGYQNTVQLGLIQETGGFSHDYDEQLDATAVNDHAAGAFRHLHTLITGEMLEVDSQRRAVDAIRLSDYFNRPVIIERGANLDHFVRGLATQPQHAPDRFFTSEITKFMFRANKTFGLDLRSIDIQRGRDHGLPSYNEYRAICGLPKAHTFDEFADVMDPQSAEALAQLYNSPDDVDMLVGGGLEHNLPGALSGHTFTCIMAEQFRRTRRGDRFWFELDGQPSSFTPEQLAEIRKSSLARLFCDNADHVTEMQHYSFKKPSKTNPIILCEQLPVVDLSFWQEQPIVPNRPEDHGFFNFLHGYLGKK